MATEKHIHFNGTAWIDEKGKIEEINCHGVEAQDFNDLPGEAKVVRDNIKYKWGGRRLVKVNFFSEDK